MTDTTVRLPKQLTVQEITERIEILEGALKRGFETKNDLIAVAPFLSNKDTRREFLLVIQPEFEKINVNRVVKLIQRQIKELKTLMTEMLDVD
jgi:hypothetical protein